MIENKSNSIVCQFNCSTFALLFLSFCSLVDGSKMNWVFLSISFATNSMGFKSNGIRNTVLLSVLRLYNRMNANVLYFYCFPSELRQLWRRIFHFSYFTCHVDRCNHPCYCRFVFVSFRLKPSLQAVATSFNNRFYSIQVSIKSSVCFFLDFVVVAFVLFQNKPKSGQKSVQLYGNH